MLDELPVLREAAESYRAAATAAGLPWTDRPRDGQPPELVYRLCEVSSVPAQLTWFQSLGWQLERLLPNGGWVMPWPDDRDEALDNLSFSVATPFPWRRQVPLFNFEIILFTFVLAESHHGEIWRYEIRPDTWQTAPAAPSLANLLTDWREALETGAVRYEPDLEWLQVAEDAPLDFALPESITDLPALKARQRDAGVDLDRVDSPATHRELLDAIARLRRSG
ncbi:hypothetical protein [Paractinoplanes globisporus]|uniref:DUF4262 domain-containing protein n=1 Tax=Paractinoplanes globisporus TaxID=113565 RepID=A0ABW6W556_9ACTN|nr:hypothetical protein [Actinoplanes globisporus]